MKPDLPVKIMTIAAIIGLPQNASPPAGDMSLKWVEADQLCGQLALDAPTKKTIIVNGKRETRLYETMLANAEIALYAGSPSDKICCGSTVPLARTRSRRGGVFQFTGFPQGYYWLEVKKGSFSGSMPLKVTEDFSDKHCWSPSTFRGFVVDAQPPKVVVHIH